MLDAKMVSLGDRVESRNGESRSRDSRSFRNSESRLREDRFYDTAIVGYETDGCSTQRESRTKWPELSKKRQSGTKGIRAKLGG